jgi:hypothetical protein
MFISLYVNCELITDIYTVIALGVSVYTAFERLTGSQRREILTALLARFVTHISGPGGPSGSMKY